MFLCVTLAFLMTTGMYPLLLIFMENRQHRSDERYERGSGDGDEYIGDLTGDETEDGGASLRSRALRKVADLWQMWIDLISKYQVCLLGTFALIALICGIGALAGAHTD